MARTSTLRGSCTRGLEDHRGTRQLVKGCRLLGSGRARPLGIYEDGLCSSARGLLASAGYRGWDEAQSWSGRGEPWMRYARRPSQPRLAATKGSIKAACPSPRQGDLCTLNQGRAQRRQGCGSSGHHFAFVDEGMASCLRANLCRSGKNSTYIQPYIQAYLRRLITDLRLLGTDASDISQHAASLR